MAMEADLAMAMEADFCRAVGENDLSKKVLAQWGGS